MVIAQGRIATVVVVPLTSNIRLGEMPGNVHLPSRKTGLPRDSVANVTQIIAIDRSLFTERVGRLTRPQLEQVLGGIDILLGR